MQNIFYFKSIMDNNNSAKKVDVLSLQDIQDMFVKPISKSTASNYLNQCREALRKQEHQFVSRSEFCDYWGLNIK